MIDARKALELAYSKGNLKKWTLESVLIDTLYNTKPENACYVKLQEVTKADYDEETEDEYLVKFGFLYRFPRTEVILHIVKKTHLLYLTRDDIGYGWDEVDKSVFDFLLTHKKKQNLIYRSSYNAEEYLIK